MVAVEGGIDEDCFCSDGCGYYMISLVLQKKRLPMDDAPSAYYVTSQEVFVLKCKKISSHPADPDTFVVTKHDTYNQEKDRVVVRITKSVLVCRQNELGGSSEMNARLEARGITEDEKFLYAMRAASVLRRFKEEEVETTSISCDNFKDLFSSETNVDAIDETLKGLIYRFFKSLPRATLSPDDIFVSTKFLLGQIQLRLLDLSYDGYIREQEEHRFAKDRDGFKRLEEERQAKSIAAGGVLTLEKEDFAFVTDKDLRAIIERDYEEVQKVRNAKDHKATILLVGSTTEALLLQALLRHSSKARNSSKAQKNKDLKEWDLFHLIEVAKELGIINADLPGLARTVKDYRNLIHPGKEVRTKVEPNAEEAEIGFQVLKKIIKKLRTTISGSPCSP